MNRLPSNWKVVGYKDDEVRFCPPFNPKEILIPITQRDQYIQIINHYAESNRTNWKSFWWSFFLTWGFFLLWALVAS